MLTQATSQPPMPENPPWNGFDIVVLVGVALAAVFTVSVGMLIAAFTFHLDGLRVGSTGPAIDRSLRLLESDVRVLLVGQLLIYVTLLWLMVQIVRRRYRQSFFASIKWNWPANHWMRFASLGIALAFAVTLLNRFLPETKELPIETLFRDRQAALLMAFFGIFIAPFMEELFFRGFLYPVLARAVGIVGAIIVTAGAFMGIHVSQLAAAWPPLLVVFLVGIAFTLVRAVSQSVAASVLTHAAYNGTLFLMLYFATQGFRHLELMDK